MLCDSLLRLNNLWQVRIWSKVVPQFQYWKYEIDYPAVIYVKKWITEANRSVLLQNFRGFFPQKNIHNLFTAHRVGQNVDFRRTFLTVKLVNNTILKSNCVVFNQFQIWNVNRRATTFPMASLIHAEKIVTGIAERFA